MNRAPNKMDKFRVSSLELEDVYEDDESDSESVKSEPKAIQREKSEVNPLKIQADNSTEQVTSRHQNTSLKNLSGILVGRSEHLMEYRSVEPEGSLFNMIEYTKKLTQQIEAKQSLFDCTVHCTSSDMLVKDGSGFEIQHQFILTDEEESRLITQNETDEPRIANDDVDEKQGATQSSNVDEPDQILVPLSDEKTLDIDAVEKNAALEITKETSSVEKDREDMKIAVTESEVMLKNLKKSLESNVELNQIQNLAELTVDNLMTDSMKDEAAMKVEALQEDVEQMSPAEIYYKALTMHDSEPQTQKNVQSSAEFNQLLEPETDKQELRDIENVPEQHLKETSHTVKTENPLVDSLCETFTHRVDSIESPFDRRCSCFPPKPENLTEDIDDDVANEVEIVGGETGKTSYAEEIFKPTEQSLIELEKNENLSENQTSTMPDLIQLGDPNSVDNALKRCHYVFSNQLNDLNVEKDKMLETVVTEAKGSYNSESSTKPLMTIAAKPTEPEESRDQVEASKTLFDATKEQVNESILSLKLMDFVNENSTDLSQLTDVIKSSSSIQCDCKASSTIGNQDAAFNIGYWKEGLKQTSTATVGLTVGDSLPKLDDDDGYLKQANFPQSELSKIASTAWIDDNASFMVTQEPSVHLRAPLGSRAQPHQVQTSIDDIAEVESQSQSKQKESKMRLCKCLKKRLSKIFKSSET